MTDEEFIWVAEQIRRDHWHRVKIWGGLAWVNALLALTYTPINAILVVAFGFLALRKLRQVNRVDAAIAVRRERIELAK
jgi:hypothetical protein